MATENENNNTELITTTTAEGDTIKYDPNSHYTSFEIKPERQKLSYLAHGKIDGTGKVIFVWFTDGSDMILQVNPKQWRKDYVIAVNAKVKLLEMRRLEQEGLTKVENMSPDEKERFRLEVKQKVENGLSFLTRNLPPLTRLVETQKPPADPDGEGSPSKLFGVKPPDPRDRRPNVHWVNGKPLDKIAEFSNYLPPSKAQGITEDDTPVRIEGVIGTLEPSKQKMLKVSWRCRECEHEFPNHTFTRLTETLAKPKACPNCLSKHPNLFEERHLRVNTRMIDLRDKDDADDSDITTMPALLIDFPEMAMPPKSKKRLPVLHPAGNQTSKIPIGGKVKVVGHVEHITSVNRQGDHHSSKSVLVSHHAEVEYRKKLELTEQDILAIKRFAGVEPLSYAPSFVVKNEQTGEWTKTHMLDMRATVLDRLCNLVAPHLVLDRIKLEAALLVATGAPESKKIRGRISALAIGPPATGKTELMYATMALREHSKMVSGAGHATGNTATAVILSEPDGTRKLHVGNVVRARHAVCGINELDKMPPEEQNKIMLEVMDKGRVPLEKFGETRDIPAETSIFATANPKGNQWSQKDRIYLTEIPIELTKISRFDIILVHRDDESEEETLQYAIQKSEKENRLERIRGEYEPHFLRRYIEYVRSISPLMTDEANHNLASYYSMLNKKNKQLFTKRQQGALKRIAKGFARLQILDKVDEAIAEQTQQFVNATLVPFFGNLIILKSPAVVVYDQAIDYIRRKGGKHQQQQWIDVTDLLQYLITKGEVRIKEWFVHGKDGKPKPLTLKANWRLRDVYHQIAQDNRLERDPTVSELRVKWRSGDVFEGGDVPKIFPSDEKSEKNSRLNIELEEALEGNIQQNDKEASLTHENIQNFDVEGDSGTSPHHHDSSDHLKTSPLAKVVIVEDADMYATDMLHRSSVAIDLEWDQVHDNRIFQAAFKDHTDRRWAYNLADEQFDGSEVDLIQAIIRTISNYRMVLGYFTHAEKSDWEVLDQRCNALGIESPIHIFVPPRRPEVEDEEEEGTPRNFINLRLKGNHGFDIIDVDIGYLHKKLIIRNFFAANNIIYNSLELDVVAKARLGRGKFKGVSGGNVLSQDVAIQKAYGIDDAELAHDLATENNDVLIAIVEDIANNVSMPFERVCNSGPARWWTNYYRNVMHIEPAPNRIIPRKKRSHSDKVYTGGKILTFKRGMYEDVTVYDYRQLYPNTAIAENIAPDVICCECCPDDSSARIMTGDPEVDAKGYWTCRKQTGSYPQALKALTALRALYEEEQRKAKEEGNTAKAIEYGLRQQSTKLFTNSGYGVFGNRYFEYADVRAAELITACGRRNLRALNKLAVEKFGFNVIYGDTDSTFVLHSTPEKQREFEELCKKPVSKGGLGIPARYEKTLSRLLLISAKNYMGERADTGKIEVKGLVGKKSNTPEWTRKIFEQVKEHWKNNEIDLMLSAVRKGVRALNRHQVSKDDLLVRTKLGQDPFRGYNKRKGQEKLPAKVLGMRHNKRQDEAVSYLLADEKLNENNYSFTEDIEEISLKKYKERLRAAVLKILYTAGFDAEAIHDALGLKMPSKKELRKLLGEEEEDEHEDES